VATNLADRFWSKVDKRGPDECWEWTAAVSAGGYGSFKVGSRSDGAKRNARAHRVAYELTFGPLPDGEGYHGTVVRHTCDNRLCSNPAHLVAGTQRDNVNDALQRGRHRGGNSLRGGEHPMAKFTIEDIREIRALYDSGEWSLRQLAERFDTNKQYISKIVRREKWSHVE
jgi:hypothetical protein